MLEKNQIEYNAVQSVFVEKLDHLQKNIENYALIWVIFQKQLMIELEKEQQPKTPFPKQTPKSEKSGFRSFFTGYSKNETEDNKAQLQITQNSESNLKLLSDIQTHCPKGLYAWGGPGCGKTFLIDALFDVLDTPHKKRFHFNEFMLRVHQKNFANSKVIFLHFFARVAVKIYLFFL